MCLFLNCLIYSCPTEVFRPSRPLQLTSVNICRESKDVRVYSCFAVFCVVLAVMCICVIYKFLSLGSAARSGQAAWEAVQKFLNSRVVNRKTQSAFREEQGLSHLLQC
jgi:hypothetical protein